MSVLTEDMHRLLVLPSARDQGHPPTCPPTVADVKLGQGLAKARLDRGRAPV